MVEAAFGGNECNSFNELIYVTYFTLIIDRHEN